MTAELPSLKSHVLDEVLLTGLAVQQLGILLTANPKVVLKVQEGFIVVWLENVLKFTIGTRDVDLSSHEWETAVRKVSRLATA